MGNLQLGSARLSVDARVRPIGDRAALLYSYGDTRMAVAVVIGEALLASAGGAGKAGNLIGCRKGFVRVIQRKPDQGRGLREREDISGLVEPVLCSPIRMPKTFSFW